MTITSTRAPAVIAALIAAFQGDQDLKPVTTYGPPKDQLDTKVYVAGYESESEWGSLGNRARNEQVTIGIVITVQGASLGAQEALESAHLLGAKVEAILRANTNLGVSGVMFLEASPRKAVIYPLTEGYGTELIYDVRYEARI